jgi:RNA polymerase sigma factor (TIGR02999 family)
MADVTQILAAVEAGDARAAAELLPLVYDELRKLATSRMAEEKPGNTLQATALVHEAYVRLVGGEQARSWDGRGHFFAAAAEAMRRILIDRARPKQTAKRGGRREREPFDEAAAVAAPDGGPAEDLLALDEALTRLEAEDPVKARLVELRYFAGTSLEEAAQLLDISPATAKRHWVYARSWLYGQLHGD